MSVMKWDQTCPKCGTTEAWGRYCTACLTPSDESWRHKPERVVASLGDYARPKAARMPHGAIPVPQDAR